MPQFLTTIKTSAAIEDIIKKAKKRIVLISPYLKLSKQLYLRLKDAAQKNVPVTVVYGKSELKSEEFNQLKSIKGIRLLFLQDLHAKCYFNEAELIVTSMNMYEFSEKNNHEMGVLFSAAEDKVMYEEVINEAALFVRNAVETNTGNVNADDSNTNVRKPDSKKSDSEYKYAKAERPDKVIIKASVKTDKRYNEPHNFHFPWLYEILSSDYPKASKSLSRLDYDPGLVIRVEDFPFAGAGLVIQNSIKFVFDDLDYYRDMRNVLRNTFENKIPKANFYWNSRDLNIVPLPDDKFKANDDGLREKVAHYLEIIRVTSACLKKYYKN